MTLEKRLFKHKIACTVLLLIVAVCMLAGCREVSQEDKTAKKMMRLYINEEELSVAWEDNESVEALKEIASDE